ncbi:MAG: hypothetical protein AABZ47_03835 [Planctomycetota bacterium]
MKRGAFRRAFSVVVAAGLIGLGGCHTVNRWTTDFFRTDYDAAERKAREQGRPILVAYYDGRKDVDRSLQEILKRSDIQKQLEGMVFCQLYRSHEPDRRYVAQFGVQRAPAMMVLHPDDTYHATAGTLTFDTATAFLESARAPGEPVRRNPLVPRRVEYEWRKSVTEAEATAKRDGRMLLVVAHRSFTSDWRRMNGLLNQREVQTRLKGMVHCELPYWDGFSGRGQTPWGEVQLPAIILVDPQGRHQVLEMPTSSEAIARFVDGGIPIDEEPAHASSSPESVP